MDDNVIKKLFKLAVDIRLNAHAPYSNFRVGAALLCDDGTIFTGCNVENASYAVATCAERVAITKAVSEGRKKFAAIAITSDMKNDETYPCGACRQIMVEFGDYDVYLVRSDCSNYKKTTVKELLPYAFTPDKLLGSSARNDNCAA